MTQEDEKTEPLFEGEAPLPIHLSMARDMSMPRYDNRFRQSRAARAKKYDCYHFYKHISRPIPLRVKEADDHERR
jgi:hypothetical protein